MTQPDRIVVQMARFCPFTEAPCHEESCQFWVLGLKMCAFTLNRHVLLSLSESLTAIQANLVKLSGVKMNGKAKRSRRK